MYPMTPSPTHSDVEDDFPTEQTSLLPEPTPAPSSKSQELVLIYVQLFTVLFLVNIAFQILAPAQIRIYEQIFCDQWYHQHSPDQIPSDGQIPERLCKIAPVQRQVSSLRGWLEFFEATPGLFMAIPIGIMSDIFGRRPFFRLCLSVITVQQFWITFVTLFPDRIPLRAIWLEGILNFICGGKMVAEMVFVCVITDITPPEKLATSFFRFNAIGALTRVLGPAIAASLMHIDAWWAIIAGLVILLVMVAITFTAPETLRSRQDHAMVLSDPNNDVQNSERVRAFWPIVTNAFRELGIIWTDWRLIFIAALYPFRMLANALNDILQLYVSNRYGWSLADATFLFSLQAIAATIVLFSIMPWVSDCIEKKFNLSAIQKNVVLTRLNIFIISIAYFVEGAAPTIPLLVGGLILETFGSGTPSTLRALAGVLVEPKDNGRVFSVLTISETLSSMIAFPATTSLFNVGLEKGGGVWLGLPFFVTGGMATMAFVAMSLLRFERP
jgi:Major Facilitator Superfamily